MADAGTDSTDGARVSPYARRLLAFVVDLVGATLVPLVLVAVGTIVVPELAVAWPWVVLLVVTVCLGVTSGLSTWLTGGLTIGKSLAGLAVRRVGGAAPPPHLRGLAWCLARSSAGYLAIDVLGLGAVTSFVTPRRRCLHDVVFGSEVVSIRDPAALGSLEDRGRRFVALLQDGMERSRERYGWLSFLWGWWSKVTVAATVAVVFVLRRIPALQLAGQVSTPAVSSTPAPMSLGPAMTTAVVVPTTAVTGLVVGSVEAGQPSYDGLRVTATIAVPDARTMALHPETGTVYVAGEDRLVAIGPEEHDVTTSTEADVGKHLVVGVRGLLHGLGDAVTTLNPSSLRPVRTVDPDEDFPQMLAPGPAGELYVLSYWGWLERIPAGSRRPEPVLDEPLADIAAVTSTSVMALVPERDQAYVVVRQGHGDPDDQLVVVVDTASGALVDTLRGLVPDQDGIVYDPHHGTVWVTSRDSIAVIDVETRSAKVLPVPVSASTPATGGGLALDGVRGIVYVVDTPGDRVRVIDTSTHSVIDTLEVDHPTAVLADPSTGALWVLSPEAGGELTRFEPPRDA